MRLLLGLLINLLLLSSAHAELSIIPLKSADETILPLVYQLISENSSASVYQRQLILQATSEEIAQVKHLLKQLDTDGENILISVKTSESKPITADVQSEISIKKSRSSVTKTTKTTRTIGQSQGYSQQSIRATTGRASFISLGQSFYTGEQWYAVDSGFYALARLHGDEVSIDIRQQESAVENKTISQQQLQSRVNGQLGQWLLIGSVLQQQDTHTAKTIHIYLKVDRL